MKVVDKATISVEDKNSLETAWYNYAAIKELIDQGMIQDSIMAKFQKAYAEYQKQWQKILTTYFEKDYSNGGYSWNCDFVKCEATIIVNS